MQKEVCRLCHRLRGEGAEWCKYCPGKTVVEVVDGISKTRVVKQADWGIEGVLIWDMKELLKEWLSDVTIARGLLEHLRPVESQGRYPLLHSVRAKHWRAFGRVRQNRFLCMVQLSIDYS